jgi:acetyl esterase/lipase
VPLDAVSLVVAGYCWLGAVLNVAYPVRPLLDMNGEYAMRPAARRSPVPDRACARRHRVLAARRVAGARVRGTVVPYRGYLMPIGYLWTVALVSWGVACALTRWRWLGPFSAIPALLVSELPFIVGYLSLASTVLALVEGNLDSPAGAAAAGVTLLAVAGLAVVVYRAMLAHAAVHNAGRPRRPWGRLLRAPFFLGRRDVVRVRSGAYGDGPRRRLDVYHRHDRPSGVPILLHVHGGGFHSGDKAREARPLIRHLTSRRGFVCVSANYRLQPHVTLADQVADVRAAIAWVRAHAAEYGADPGSLFVAGSSAGAYLAIQAACEGETGITGLICRYGYYGNLAPRGEMPPILLIHGHNDTVVPPSAASAFAERVRTVSSRPVI